MVHPYQRYSLSKIYHQEALQEARRRHIVKRARAHRGPRESGRLGLVWRSVLSLVRGA
jgi:hypothetical protein